MQKSIFLKFAQFSQFSRWVNSGEFSPHFFFYIFLKFFIDMKKFILEIFFVRKKKVGGENEGKFTSPFFSVIFAMEKNVTHTPCGGLALGATECLVVQ